MNNAVSHRDLANAARFLAIDAIERAGSGHPGMCMGIADAATVLFTRFLKFDPNDPLWPDRDRFVLSAGHGSALLYALLHLSGCEKMTLDEVLNFRRLGSCTPGHPEYDPGAAIETTTGPLGQGFANAVGMAVAERILNARYGNDLVDHFTYVIVGDGCLMEGLSYEAAALAGHLRLDKLIVLWDDNSITVDGGTDLASSEDQIARFRAAGWETLAVDGHDPEAVASAIANARASNQPSFIACRTTIAIGAPTKAGTNLAHGGTLGADEVAGARETLGWPHEPFEIPHEILREWRKAGKTSVHARKKWDRRLAETPDIVRREFELGTRGELPSNWDGDVAELMAAWRRDEPAIGTVEASAATIAAIGKRVPHLIGGAADVASLTGSDLPTDVVLPGAFSGRNIRFGIREHAMAAAMNGLACHGSVLPFGATYLVFSDYLRPALRMSAMMGLQVVYILADDSIAVGENGPTHQPVEQLASLRAIPNLHVFRPADAIETAQCWRIAMERKNGPSAILLTKIPLPPLPQNHDCERGAYVVAEAPGGIDARRATLFATGSDVQIALDARRQLIARRIPTAVVSVPCWELFWTQDKSYCDMVISRGTIRAAIEAGSGLGWERFVGEDGVIFSMNSFGASAPAAQLFQHFGLTSEAVVQAVKTNKESSR
ncbi:MAG: transketolase [Rhodospirillales bacterium]|nr:transketolase [Rhodospirillales bacterium]